MSQDKVALVFTMHKVGSSSVMQAFRSIGRLPERGFEENLDYLQPLDKYEKVVTLVRDPIARNISYFFENWKKFMGVEPHLYQGDLWGLFLGTVNPFYPSRFFDSVFFPTFGVDVYEHKFNRSKGYVIIDNHYLVIRTDKIKTKLGKALIELFDLPEGTEVQVEQRASTISTRPYGEFYDKFVSEAMFDHEYLSQMYDSKYAKHFFTAKEIKDLKEKWKIKTG